MILKLSGILFESDKFGKLHFRTIDDETIPKLRKHTPDIVSEDDKIIFPKRPFTGTYFKVNQKKNQAKPSQEEIEAQNEYVVFATLKKYSFIPPGQKNAINGYTLIMENMRKKWDN
ncbi:MAG: hypothetical protein KAS12_01425 [Candidatus Aenigmarchaeota archaeon]|nr:hypothetical protein [Candidatus Aenigmarchaeota archaeon]